MLVIKETIFVRSWQCLDNKNNIFRSKKCNKELLELPNLKMLRILRISLILNELKSFLIVSADKTLTFQSFFLIKLSSFSWFFAKIARATPPPAINIAAH